MTPEMSKSISAGGRTGGCVFFVAGVAVRSVADQP